MAGGAQAKIFIVTIILFRFILVLRPYIKSIFANDVCCASAASLRVYLTEGRLAHLSLYSLSLIFRSFEHD